MAKRFVVRVKSKPDMTRKALIQCLEAEELDWVDQLLDGSMSADVSAADYKSSIGGGEPVDGLPHHIEILLRDIEEREAWKAAHFA